MNPALAQMSFETLSVEQDGDVLIIALNRPAVANAINTQMGRDLQAAFSNCSNDPDPPRAIILTAKGDRHFCAGGDLKERNGMTDEDFLKQHAIYERMLLAIVDCQVPVIAALNGVAYAGGCEIALACDFVYASTNTRFALTETSIGIMPGCGGTQNLARAIGMRRAKQLILSAEPFSVDEAFQWGLVNKVVASDCLLSEALAAAKRISRNAPLAVRQAKKAIDYGTRMDLRSALFFEVEAYNRLVTTADRLEGIAAFNEKRPPAFKGR